VPVDREGSIDEVDGGYDVESDPCRRGIVLVVYFDDLDLSFCGCAAGEGSWEKSFFVAQSACESVESRSWETSAPI
jgi:hypothetical protein